MARSDSLTRRALLSGALFVGFWLLGAGLVAALAWIPLAQWLYARGPDAAGVAAGAGALLLAWSLRPRLGIRWARPAGPAPIGATEAPALHQLVTEIARRTGVRPPDELRLSPRGNASIGQERWRAGLSRARVLELGLPLFAMLTRDELASVVAHELGHERAGDVLLGAWVHRTRASLAGTLADLEGSAFLLDAPFRAYGALFLRASGSVSRSQELAADACAAAACGPSAAWGALHRIEAFGGAWDVYFHHDAVPAIERGARVPLLDGFRRFLAAQRHRPAVARALEAAADEAPSPGDTHPPRDQRLAAIDPRRRVGGAPDLAGCLELLGGEAAAEEAWYRRALAKPLPRVGWDELAETTLLPGLAADLTGGPLDPALTDLARLPELVRDAEAVWASVRRGVNLHTPGARRRQGLQLLGGWLALGLRHRGFRAQARPGAELRLWREGFEVEPWATVAALGDGTLQPGGWCDWLGALDASPPEPPPPQPE
jgi:Zn-dependent protease with chaperone function